MTQEQLVDICRLMDINKDGLVDLNEFLESFRLAEKSLQDEDNEATDMTATWQELDRRPSRTAVDRDDTAVCVEILRLDEPAPPARGNGTLSSANDEIQLIDCDTPKRPGLLESDI